MASGFETVKVRDRAVTLNDQEQTDWRNSREAGPGSIVFQVSASKRNYFSQRYFPGIFALTMKPSGSIFQMSFFHTAVISSWTKGEFLNFKQESLNNLQEAPLIPFAFFLTTHAFVASTEARGIFIEQTTEGRGKTR